MRKGLCLMGAVLILAGCASDSRLPLKACPQVAVLRDVAQVEDYAREVPSAETLVAAASMKRVEGHCGWEDDGIEVVFDLLLTARKGPRLGGQRVTFPSFVTVVSPEGKILNKEQMTSVFTFSGDEKVAELTEPMRVVLPAGAADHVADYRVLAGFQLSEEQLKQVREKTAHAPQ